MKKIIGLVLLLLPVSPAIAARHECDDESAIIAVVEEFFTAMTDRDAAIWQKIMIPDGIVIAVRTSADNEESAISRTAQESIDSLTPDGPRLLERMWDPVVAVHGSIATLWAPYDFHIDGKFSHCGVDSFQMIRQGDQWKIANVIYTAETTGCPPSPLGPVE